MDGTLNDTYFNDTQFITTLCSPSISYGLCSNYDSVSDKHNTIFGSMAVIFSISTVATLAVEIYKCRRKRHPDVTTPRILEAYGNTELNGLGQWTSPREAYVG